MLIRGDLSWVSHRPSGIVNTTAYIIGMWRSTAIATTSAIATTATAIATTSTALATTATAIGLLLLLLQLLLLLVLID